MPASARIDVATLLGLGLEERLAQLWIAMASAPGAGVEELADVLGISESQARVALDALADRALVRVSQQTPGLLVPVTAEAALRQLLRRQEEELAEQQRRIEEQRDQITKAVSASARDSDDGRVEHIVGADAIHARFEQLAYRTETSIDSLLPVTGLPAQMLSDAKPLDVDLLQRGVAMRSLYLEAIRNDAPLMAYARDMQAAGADVRTSPTLPQRLFISDRCLAVVPVDPSTRAHGVLLVRTPGVVASLLELFETVWHNAAPLDVGNPIDTATGLSDTERILLTMLADGATDESAAKRLGVSLRTVRRIMADLMRRLDAGSRFEAGIKAARRGWL
ncbi:transcriptional regulator, TrmB [Catenulispora acidiphila DSM 44928]|uniref:Transcriptional regulator, TrmB n=1 Tax=Catenulispora acidiphila (strain DSM 44928 / JCM 14897 / NBRC 102108 / NRRL B-24433 / ID139908) TaxID=479433 RepID=C7QIK4_CATAD|nr:LuxR family transcriptional regulator [Catenulispora acidiphila]ACU75081.1 transcriptional regulator, TrmB [Catenulispora acidiphila DSM 44928]